MKKRIWELFCSHCQSTTIYDTREMNPACQDCGGWEYYQDRYPISVLIILPIWRSFLVNPKKTSLAGIDSWLSSEGTLVLIEDGEDRREEFFLEFEEVFQEDFWEDWVFSEHFLRRKAPQKNFRRERIERKGEMLYILSLTAPFQALDESLDITYPDFKKSLER